MAPSRQERFLMRQRGAGARQIEDFGLDIGLPGSTTASLKPQRSGRSRRTPKPEVPAQSSARSGRTPLSKQLQLRSGRARRTPVPDLPPQRSSRRTPGPAIEPSAPSSPHTHATSRSLRSERLSVFDIPEEDDGRGMAGPEVTATRLDLAERSSKKRKLNNISKPAKEQTPGRKSLRGRQRASTILEATPGEESPFERGASTDDLGSLAVNTLRDRMPTVPEESSTPKNNIDQAVLQNETTNQEDDIQHEATDPPMAVTQTNVPSRLEARKSKASSSPSLSLNPGTNLSTKRRKKRNSRMSLTKPPKKRKSISQGLLPDPSNTTLEIDSPLATVPPPEVTRSRSHNNKTASIRDSESQELVEAPHKTAIRAKKTVSKRKATSMPDHLRKHSPGSKQKLNTVPVIVSRISRPRNNADDSEDDILAIPGSFPKLSGVNSIDVLGQVCRELVEKALDDQKKAVQMNDSSTSKEDWKRQKKVIELFGEELDSRLFQMAEALDNKNALSTRLRQAKKAKKDAQDRLIKIRREREEIAIRTDEIRLRHERETKIAMDNNELDDLVTDIELAVQRGRAEQRSQGEVAPKEHIDSGALELRVRDVATKVSSAGGIGLLDQVKNYNALLERAVAVL